MENEEKKGVGWIIPGRLYHDLVKIAKAEKRSVVNTAVLILEKGIKIINNAQISESMQRNIAENKTIDVISNCSDLEQLNSVLTMINLFVMAFGESDRIHRAYDERKSVLN